MKMTSRTRNRWILTGALLLVVALSGLVIFKVTASPAPAQPAQTSPMHPQFALLDSSGTNVLESGQPVSTLKTCGECHDTEFISSHSFHSDLGLSDLLEGQPASGIFGQWDPLTYRYLSQAGDARLDLGTADWLRLNANLVVGGGPATTSRDGDPLASLPVRSNNPETTVLNPDTGRTELWNWNESGTIEMNCFVCHMPQPNNQARVASIQSGQFGWANTATLSGTGLVEMTGEGWAWQAAAFDESGQLLPDFVTIQDPTNDNCAQCHGVIHAGSQEPLTLPVCTDLSYPQTATTGQVISPERLSESGVNLAGKADLSRSWDIHAERQVQCVDCHYALNNPALSESAIANRPSHLIFDPRRLDLGEYLQYPDHNLARGQSAQYDVAPELKGSMRRCESCHDAGTSHANWLPYSERHMAVVACETCHIPQVYAPAIEAYDWTVIDLEGQAATACRGVGGDGDTVNNLVTGYQPVLMQRANIDGGTALAPYNLVTSWYWVYEDNGNSLPVRLIDLQAAYLENGEYASEIVTAFDADSDGEIDDAELAIDSQVKQDAVAARLSALGLENPHIVGLVQPYSINHNVTRGENGINDCETCHTSDSRLAQAIELAAYVPGGVTPEFVSDTNVSISGEIFQDGSALYYAPDPSEDGRYVFGHSRYGWVDWLGGLFFLGVLAGVGGHTALRVVKSAKAPRHPASTRKVYMYQAYERLWHWLQTAAIVILLCTGLIIHRPDLFGIFSFRGMVTIHNVLAALLAINAALSLFYHLASGQIRQFLPRPRGFFDDAIVQARYYLNGIFKRDAHPFEKTAEKKLNPLQQVTYFGILTVLLPLQGLTGILMWGVQRWPEYARFLGGLPGLAAFHTLLASIFAAFIVGHVYLTTTGGPKPLDSIKAMVTGWEEVETRHGPESESKKESKA